MEQHRYPAVIRVLVSDRVFSITTEQRTDYRTMAPVWDANLTESLPSGTRYFASGSELTGFLTQREALASAMELVLSQVRS